MRDDNAFTLLGHINDQPQPYTQSEAASISVPTLFIIGGETPDMLPVISEVLSAHVQGAVKGVIPDAGRSMFRQQQNAFSNSVLQFLKSQ